MTDRAVEAVLLSPALPPGNVNINDWFAGRQPFRQAFLKRVGWAGSAAESVGEDCAYRRYFRLRRSEKTAILMEAVPERHAIATPGHNISDFIRLGSWLREHGIYTPEVYEADTESGYLLLEDFGDVSFKKALHQGVAGGKIYSLAVDVLARMRDLTDIPALPAYQGSHVDRGRRRVVDWYMPVAHGRKNPGGLAEEYNEIWAEIEKTLPPCPTGFLHIDYHVENLMWLPHRRGLERCGVLDFQGAMQGPQPYDLANLLEDPRQDIPADLRREMFDRFAAGLPAGEKEAFAGWHRIMAAQFHCRVIGQFIKLALTAGKTRYMQFVPRLEGYIREDLEDPLLAPLAEWFSSYGLFFDAGLSIVQEDGLGLIRADAF